VNTVIAAPAVSSNQVRGFLAAWGGWALDGMDGSIYGLVLVPALTELLPHSNIAVTPGNIGYYGSVLLALFLFGWGLSMIWGPISDRIGRVRALMLTILCYSLFTFLCGFVTTIWQLAGLRLLCGLGIGGEQPVGAAYIAESLSENQRKIGAGLMHTGYYFGFFAAAVINYFVGATYGWRVMFYVGGLPALLIGFIRYGVSESPVWQRARTRQPRMRDAFAALFSPAFRRRTLVMSVLFLISILGFWGGSTYVPASVTQIAMRSGMKAPDAARMASYGSMLLSAGTIIGCVVIPFVAERVGRRWATALFFLITMVTIATAFGDVFYVRDGALPLFLTLLFVLGVGGANVAIYTIWLPEQFPTDCRASAIAFISSSGRFIAVAAVFVVGAGIARYGSIGVPVALMALLYLLGIVLLPLTVETRGKALPL
jgi:MFS family permease